MPLPSEHSARLQDPARYERFRRENDKFGPGIHAVWGITGDGSAELQAIRFDAATFSEAQARAWLEEHGHTPLVFEAASTEDGSVDDGAEARGGVRLHLVAADAGVRVTGVAYSGGRMRLPGWSHPVVVDLTGLSLPDTVPLLTNHENRTASRVGMVRARIAGHELMIDGEILSSSGQAQGIVEQARAGGDWQLSIGAEATESELVRGARTVNGQEQTGPFYHVKKSVLREVSIVAVGADLSTRMQLAARFHLEGGQAMNFEQWLAEHQLQAEGLTEDQIAVLRAAFEAGEEPPDLGQAEANPAQAKPPKGPTPEGQAPRAEPKPEAAPVTAASETGDPDPAQNAAERAVRSERERVAAIQEICGGEFPDLEREAIRGGWNREATSQKVLQAMRSNRPQADVGLIGGDRATGTRVLEAALCLRAGLDGEQLVKDYGDRVVEGAYRERDLSLQQLLVECAALEGVSVPRSFCNDTIRAAFSTVSLPGILNNVANKRLLKSFQAQPVIATKLCSEGELNDFKESERYRLTDVGDLEPVAADGELQHGGLKEDKATNRLGTFGKTFTLTRQMIFNDDLSAFLKVPDGMGARGAKKIDQLFFTRLLANPNNLFSTAHKNTKAGATTALSADSLAAAVQMFLDQVDADGQPINISPQYLLVPTSLKMPARQLLNSVLFIATGSTDAQNIPTYNALADENLEVVSSPYLSNANYTGASSKAWYLFANPSVVDTFEIGYLKGRRTPTVEQGETDFDTLGIRFRVYFDLGVREQDHRGMVKFKGEA
jgi:hypothetical protein